MSTSAPTAEPPSPTFAFPRALPDRLLWIILGFSALATVGSLVRFWGIRPEYADRFLVLLGSAYAAFDISRRCTGGRRASPPLTKPRPLVAFPFMLIGGLVAAFGWFLQVQTSGGRAAVLWFQAGGLMLLIAGAILARDGASRLRAFVFPLIYVGFALPIPSLLMGPLQTKLQTGMTFLAEHTLPLLGVPVLQRDGFVLRLQGGDLGVAEACSGVRSLTALTALAAFIAYWRGFGPIRGTALVLLSVPIVAAVNGVRVILSGLIQEWIGSEYIRGDWHEALGFSMVFLGLFLITRLAKWLGGTPPDPVAEKGSEETPLPETERGRNTFGAWLAVGCAVMSLGLAGFAIARGLLADVAELAKAPLQEIPLTLGTGREQWQCKREEEIPEFVSEMLGQDAAICRIYENNTGQKVFVWVIFWSTADMVKGYHHPDVCWGNKGFVSTAKRIETLRPTSGGEIAATARDFTLPAAKDRDGMFQYILYWTQEGRRVWDSIDEDNARAGGFFFEKALQPRNDATTSNGRLVVLIGTTSSIGQPKKEETLKFAKLMADQLYLVCPWAGPPLPPR